MATLFLLPTKVQFLSNYIGLTVTISALLSRHDEYMSEWNSSAKAYGSWDFFLEDIPSIIKWWNYRAPPAWTETKPRRRVLEWSLYGMDRARRAFSEEHLASESLLVCVSSVYH